MRILCWNVNGLRAIHKKGFLQWLEMADADIVCLQETRVLREELPIELTEVDDYTFYLNPAEKKGYAGVGVYSKEKPKQVDFKLGFKQFDQEGRILKLEYSDFILINLYLPHGGRQKENLEYKLKAYNHLLKLLKTIKNKKVILTGDFNIAHQEIDLARPEENKNSIMFTEDERKQIDKIIQLGFKDSFRIFHKQGNNYTWWPYFAKARERNLGWRIDYIFISEPLASEIKNAFILDKIMGSDHCPVGIEIF
ncbi:MAG: exodeoxyribonuclease III [Candidatus Pacebacteria bacterium]|nr:exodeoxyribonuclease III [Candidatus Paceibacterota bacterium]MDD5721777.1 exodeoxyribonuclease III [Candidatus Paceibacterota bacterium]